MLKNSPFYAGFAVDDVAKAKEFYGRTLGVFNVAELREAGVEFEHYDEGPLKTDEKGIATPGPKQAWFRDPAGNILWVVEAT